MERGPRGEAVAQTSRHLPPTGIPDPPHGRGPSRTSFLMQSALGLLPVWSRGGNGRPERSERSTDQKRAERPRQLPRRSARHRSRHAGFTAGGDGSRPRSGSRVFQRSTGCQTEVGCPHSPILPKCSRIRLRAWSEAHNQAGRGNALMQLQNCCEAHASVAECGDKK
ncbi:hypothetical protein NDU88_004787 [Pleurodeles waltl]|uniref:Uncharacterized protein n=1 Tax=Pleurodeles waltl TaxID=8319 RepID=A0AAV7KYT9_PLEWA|nr:hypothetical protein NDU88_004787 [Pleurodeles waltl]